MTIKVFGPGYATSVSRVILTLKEKQVHDYEVISVDVAKGEHKSPEFMEKQVPYIVDGDFTLFETRAIARYVATKYANQGTALCGSTAAERALVEQWIEVESQNVTKTFSHIVYNLMVAPMLGVPADDALVTEETAKLEKIFDIYERRLSESAYLAGDFFSLADLFHIGNLYYLDKVLGLSALFDSRPHLRKWVNSLLERDSVKSWQGEYFGKESRH